ncbi:TniB family NTP-binding protein [Lacimicrobium sp. SS2-24]|uniref:TniB family NTP-binding protein n=1 Tax=Lacimicrobium sp. SS2-24 TaxID=2005569 RepID=UPI000B4BF29E|nr:TniB family NTP-binding protein [Lacimicrobium sp. SS2-24]
MTLLDKSVLLESLTVSQGSLEKDLDTLKLELDKILASSTKGRGVVISGESGSGKTTLLKKFIEQIRNEVSESKAFEIVYMETPSNPVGKDLFETMLEAAGSPFDSIEKLSRLKERQQQREIETLIKNRNIRVWVLDEFQQATEKWGDKKIRQTADFLKLILNNFPILLIFAGTDKVRRLLENEQFDSRATPIEKRPVTISNISAWTEYLDYLATLQEYAKIEGIKWDDPKIALSIFYDSRGDLRKITDILQTALLLAHRSGDSKLFKKHFIEAWKPRYRHSENEEVYFKSNTFEQPLEKLMDALRINYDVDA